MGGRARAVLEPEGLLQRAGGRLQNGTPIEIDSRGKFSRKVVDRYRMRGTRYEETQLVTGTITDGELPAGSEAA